jgi:hypothetical protein
MTLSTSQYINQPILPPKIALKQLTEGKNSLSSLIPAQNSFYSILVQK